MQKSRKAAEQVAAINARQIFLVLSLSFATFCLFAQIAKSFLG